MELTGSLSCSPAPAAARARRSPGGRPLRRALDPDRPKPAGRSTAWPMKPEAPWWRPTWPSEAMYRSWSRSSAVRRDHRQRGRRWRSRCSELA
jgi:hypothetical protein